MYSDMSMRTRWVSSSNRNSARARASSVFPTPVGPRKMNEPMGRLGSCRPARERRTALAMASTAWSCPITRVCRRSSILVRRSCSPSSIFSTGMPVHFDTTAAMSSSVTSSRRKEPPFWADCSSVFLAPSAFSSSGRRPKRSSAARFRSPRRWASCSSVLAASMSALNFWISAMSAFSRCHRAFIEWARSRSSAISSSTTSSRRREASSPSLCSADCSMASEVRRRST